MKKHPHLNLYCNADGTRLTLNGKLLHVSYTVRDGEKQSGTVSINGKKRSAATVICECFYGMREDKSYFPVRKDGDATNNHPSNLSWGKRRGAVKIAEKQIKELNKAFAQGKKVKDLAKKYNVTPQTIRGYRKKYIERLPVVDAETIS
jgi:hypothetical protein